MKNITAFGLGTVTGAVGVIVTVLTIAGPVQRDRANAEQAMRLASCAITDKRAQAFIANDLPPVIKAIREDRAVPDNERLDHIAVLTTVSMLQERVLECRKVVGAAQADPSLITRFDRYYDLFALLHPFMRLWQLSPPNEIKGVDITLAKLQELQAQLSSSSRTSQ
jgi:hypothetical protein